MTRWITLAFFLAACSEAKTETKKGDGEPERTGRMSAADACKALVSKGFGTGCKSDKPGGLGAAAWEAQGFDLAEPAGKSCQVLGFKKREDLDATIKAFDGAAALAGPHRYSNAGRLIFVQCNAGMPREAGEKLDAAVSQP
jgi:hypothetical protein